MKDVGHQELADMLDFMYRGEASVRQEDLAAFLKLAETLKVKGLAGDKVCFVCLLDNKTYSDESYGNTSDIY